MNYKYYEKKLNDVITKSRIETGIEIIAFNVLDEIITNYGLTLCAIDSITSDNEPRLNTEGGFSDLAVVSNDFEYGNVTNSDKAYGFIEVKAPYTKISSNDPQFIGQGNDISKKHSHIYKNLYTNGLVWIYRGNNSEKWEINLTKSKMTSSGSTKVEILKNEFLDLLTKLRAIKW